MSNTATIPDVTPIEAFDVDDIARAWRVRSQMVRSLITSGELPSFRVGVRVRIARTAAEEFIRKQEAIPWQPAPSRSGGRSSIATFAEELCQRVEEMNERVESAMEPALQVIDAANERLDAALGRTER